MKKLISIIGPMYNEEAMVSQFCEEISKAMQRVSDRYEFEIVLVDDGSTDGTLHEMQCVRKRLPQHITLVQLSRNFGLEGAIHAGLRCSAGDAVVAMDADLQDPPDVILAMIKEWESGADIVVGSRAARPNDGLFKRATARAFYGLLGALSGKLQLEKDAANFRLLDRKAVSAVLSLPEVNGVFRVVVPFLGMKTSVVSYDRDKRFAGKTKYKLASMVRYALDSLTGISVEPLRKTSLATVLSFVLTLSFGLTLLFATREWVPSLLLCAVVSLLFTLLFLVLSVIAEYIAQIYIEVKARPISIIYDHRPSIASCQRRHHE